MATGLELNPLWLVKASKNGAFKKGLFIDYVELDENDKWVNYRSITADDDLRLHYRLIDKDTALFVAVGTHDELYR